MKKNAQTAFEELKTIGAPVFERSDVENFLLSAEENETRIWAYYFTDTIDNEVKAILNKHELWVEWETAGALIVYQY